MAHFEFVLKDNAARGAKSEEVTYCLEMCVAHLQLYGEAKAQEMLVGH